MLRNRKNVTFSHEAIYSQNGEQSVEQEVGTYHSQVRQEQGVQTSQLTAFENRREYDRGQWRETRALIDAARAGEQSGCSECSEVCCCLLGSLCTIC